jgi:hypothetical protein
MAEDIYFNPTPEMPDRLNVGETGRTISVEEAKKLPRAERIALWYASLAHHGKPLFPFFDDTGANALGSEAELLPRMSRYALTSLGLTDEELEKERTKLFGERPDQAAPPLSSTVVDTDEVMVERKRVFDQVSANWYSAIAPKEG